MTVIEAGYDVMRSLRKQNGTELISTLDAIIS